MYKPVRYRGFYHDYARVYPPYTFEGTSTWRHVPDRGDEDWPNYGRRQPPASTFGCALPGPLCVGARCQGRKWICPDTTSCNAGCAGQECSKVDLADGTWGWVCKQKT
jgi:hypothetical protein